MAKSLVSFGLPSKSALFCAVLALFQGCAPAAPPAADQERLEAVIHRLQKGELIDSLNSKGTIGLNDGVALSFEAPALQSSAADPCPEVPAVDANSTREHAVAALAKFGACMRTLFTSATLRSNAIEVMKYRNLAPGSKLLSEMNPLELDALVTAVSRDIPIALFAPAVMNNASTRTVFADRDLEELKTLAHQRDMLLALGARDLFAAVQSHSGLLQRFSSIDRYRALALLGQIHEIRTQWIARGGDPDEVKARIDAVTASLVELLKERFRVPLNVATFPNHYLPTYGIRALIPDLGREADPLYPVENPFEAVVREAQNLGGGDRQVGDLVEIYRKVRNADNPVMPAHWPAATDAVRVAFIDTGLDFVQYPDLGVFAGDGRDGQLAQGDFVDRDTNSYIPAEGLLGHGTGTTATLLTILSHYAPEVLHSRKLDLAMWKVASARSILGGFPLDPTANFNPYAITGLADAIWTGIEGKGVKPKILSISMQWPMKEFLDALGKPELLLKSPWLWVISAGNDGKQLGRRSDQARTNCLEDVPSKDRPDARILCVGALEKGMLEDKIADYSNYGDRVEVYAYESYFALCPNGTSCATPAITAAATIIAAKYPTLTPEQIKRVILDSSEERVLPTKHPDGTRMGARKAVRVFDPAVMMPRALERAKAVATAPAQAEKPWWWPF